MTNDGWGHTGCCYSCKLIPPTACMYIAQINKLQIILWQPFPKNTAQRKRDYSSIKIYNIYIQGTCYFSAHLSNLLMRSLCSSRDNCPSEWACVSLFSSCEWLWFRANSSICMPCLSLRSLIRAELSLPTTTHTVSVGVNVLHNSQIYATTHLILCVPFC